MQNRPKLIPSNICYKCSVTTAVHLTHIQWLLRDHLNIVPAQAMCRDVGCPIGMYHRLAPQVPPSFTVSSSCEKLTSGTPEILSF